MGVKMSSSAKDARLELGKILRTRRLEQNLTQRDLAQKLDLDYTYVSKIENGTQTPSVDSLIRLAEILGLSNPEVNELLALMGRLPDDLPVQQRRRLAMYYPERRRQ
jgi:transcriptional regulator with XRE-family HTH domain